MRKHGICADKDSPIEVPRGTSLLPRAMFCPGKQGVDRGKIMKQQEWNRETCKKILSKSTKEECRKDISIHSRNPFFTYIGKDAKQALHAT